MYEKEMKAYNMLGMLYRGKGDYQEALNQFDAAMGIEECICVFGHLYIVTVVSVGKHCFYFIEY